MCFADFHDEINLVLLDLIWIFKPIACIIGSHNFKGAARGLFSEDHASSYIGIFSYIPYGIQLIFHRYPINLFTGAMIQAHLEHAHEEFIENTLNNQLSGYALGIIDYCFVHWHVLSELVSWHP